MALPQVVINPPESDEDRRSAAGISADDSEAKRKETHDTVTKWKNPSSAVVTMETGKLHPSSVKLSRKGVNKTPHKVTWKSDLSLTKDCEPYPDKQAVVCAANVGVNMTAQECAATHRNETSERLGTANVRDKKSAKGRVFTSTTKDCTDGKRDRNSARGEQSDTAKESVTRENTNRNNSAKSDTNSCSGGDKSKHIESTGGGEKTTQRLNATKTGNSGNNNRGSENNKSDSLPFNTTAECVWETTSESETSGDSSEEDYKNMDYHRQRFLENSISTDSPRRLIRRHSISESSSDANYLERQRHHLNHLREILRNSLDKVSHNVTPLDNKRHSQEFSASAANSPKLSSSSNRFFPFSPKLSRSLKTHSGSAELPAKRSGVFSTPPVERSTSQDVSATPPSPESPSADFFPPPNTLQKIRERLNSFSGRRSSMDFNLSDGPIKLRRRHSLAVAVPRKITAPLRRNATIKRQRKMAQENDDALNAMLMRVPERKSPSPSSSFRSYPSRSDRSQSSQRSSSAERDDQLLKAHRHSTLIKLMQLEEEERLAQAPEESKRLLEDITAPCAQDDVGPVKFFTHELSLRGRLRRFFIRNPSTRLASTFFDLFVKVIVCVVYVLRVVLDDPTEYSCNGSPCNQAGNSSVPPEDNMVFTTAHIHWYVLLWVHRPLAVWIVEVVLAVTTLSKDLLFIYITTKGHRLEQVLTSGFLLEVICTVPMIATACYPTWLQHLFVPTFLNCWLAKRALERIFNDLHLTRQRFQTISVTLSQQMMLLLASLVCLVFTTICGIQHIQRGSFESPLTLFESLYFVIVTFSTVGYGDISPDIWLGQLFMILMIVVAFTFIPRQIEVLASTWLERQKAGGEYSRRSASRNKHVIVCSSMLTQETVMDFLNEFYSHPKLEEHMVILLCPQEMDSSMHVILKDPKWAHRVIFMRGSSLKDIDLKRCRIHQAEACFFLAPRPAGDKNKADQHTVLRSWAVKDYAPHCKQYIQLFKAKNKMHVKFAEHVVCEDEFKYALLANNCLYPGLSTLVALLVHTSSGLEGDLAPHPWQQIYGRHSGNEIYHIQLGKSVFFSRYEGSRFTQASAEAHHRFGVTLLAVLDGDGSQPRRLQLNPGPEYILKKNDFCFYMSVTREEYTEISPQALTEKPTPGNLTQNLELIAEALEKYHSEDKEAEMDDYDTTVFDTITSLMGRNITRRVHHQRDKELLARTVHINNNKRGEQGDDETRQPLLSDPDILKTQPESGEGLRDVNADRDSVDSVDTKSKSSSADLDEMDHRHDAGKVMQFYNDMGQEKLTTGPPPVTIYMGSRRAVCHVMREPRPFCCLEWGTDCSHCSYKNAGDERWHHQLIIVAAQRPSSGIHNFIVPLRSSFISVNGMSPIVLLLEKEPDPIFLDTISQFPLVYWMKGSILSIDDMLRAGINKASHLVVVNRESEDNMAGEETLADSETIIAVQTVFRMFPNANIISELSQASNMRFMQFSAQDVYMQKVSRLEQKLKETMTSNLNHIFRLPFAAGQVFSASMLDTLLYQTFVKGYLITFVRLLLGIDAEEGSGHLSSIRVKRGTVDKFPTYGELYQGLCSATGEIPIAIYRTERHAVALKPDGEVEEEPEVEKKPGRLHKKAGLVRKPSHTWSPFTVFNNSEVIDVGGLVRNRLKSLDMSAKDYSEVKKKPNSISYVIANPAPQRRLKVGDIIYVIQPSSMQAKPMKSKSWVQRSHSFSGPYRPRAGSAGAASKMASKLTVDANVERIGRFKLKRSISERNEASTSEQTSTA